mmetsp:Transcript_33408/g.96514  ORF Transcript_33408/g.96514 Transcript_33408/m.96514 type:complete len:212 (-) Transcript_33408:15-650(-)
MSRVMTLRSCLRPKWNGTSNVKWRCVALWALCVVVVMVMAAYSACDLLVPRSPMRLDKKLETVKVSFVSPGPAVSPGCGCDCGGGGGGGAGGCCCGAAPKWTGMYGHNTWGASASFHTKIDGAPSIDLMRMYARSAPNASSGNTAASSRRIVTSVSWSLTHMRTACRIRRGTALTGNSFTADGGRSGKLLGCCRRMRCSLCFGTLRRASLS